MILKKVIPWLLLFILLSALNISCINRKGTFENKVVVKVNQSELTAGQFSDLLIHKLKSFNALSAKDAAIVNQAKNSVIQDFIVRTITQEWAQKNGLFVRKEQLDDAINKIRKDYPDDLAFRKALSEEGLPYKDWEERVRETLLEKIVIEKIREDISAPTQEEIRAYYNDNKPQYLISPQIRVKQIVLSSEESAELVRRELAQGKNFSGLAKKFSITPEGKEGGEIGWVERGFFEVFDAGFRMGIGQKSRVIKSPYGFHIIEVTGRRGARQTPLNEVEEQIKRHLIEEKEQEAYSSWLEQQVLDATVFKDEEIISQIQVRTRG